MKTVVPDSTPLIFLAKVGRLDLLRNVFGRVSIPEAVFDEAVTQGKAIGMSDASIIEAAVGRWIHVEHLEAEVESEYRFLDDNMRLGLGEREALKLCKQLNADFFIVDDREARRVSRILNLVPLGTCGVIVEACRQGSISSREALQTLDTLVRVGFRVNATVYRRVLDELEPPK